MSKLIDLYIDQGSNFVATLPPVSTPDGSILDLTGYTITCQIRRSYSTVYAVQLTTNTITNGELGSVLIGTPGTGYLANEVLTFTGANTTVAQAKIRSVGTNGAITGVTITNAGAGYVSAPSVGVTSVSGANAVLTAALKKTYIQLSLLPEETAGLIATRYVYDVVIVNGSTQVNTKVFEGLAIVNPGVTSRPSTTLLSSYIPDDFGGV